MDAMDTSSIGTATIRRTQARASLRENRQPATRRRPRTRSPESRPPSASSMNPQPSTSVALRKRKKQLQSTPTPNNSRQNQSQDEDHPLRKGKSKAKLSTTRSGDLTDRGRHNEQLRSWKRNASPDAIEADDESSAAYSGPLAVAEFNRLKLEVEKLREQLHHTKKTIHKQSRVIDELRQDITTANKFNKEQAASIEKLKSKSKKSDDLISNIESSLQCQICLDTLHKPFMLSPCGHCLCQECLQKWFRAAPANEDDMYDDDDPAALVHRRKSCPCCRTVVRTRPVPLFILKYISSAFDKAKSPSGSRQPSPPPDSDPWAGIFPDQDHNMSSDDDQDDDDDDDDGYGWAEYDVHGYGSDSDEASYEGDYVHARWQPPSVHIDPHDYSFDDLDSDDFKMLRRGATLQMIELFSMQYSHREGLSALVDDMNRVFLGWNIRLHHSDDTGEEYIDWIVNDVFERGERWEVEEDEDGSWVAWKMVPVEEDEAFDSTDSEAWMVDDGADESE